MAASFGGGTVAAVWHLFNSWLLATQAKSWRLHYCIVVQKIAKISQLKFTTSSLIREFFSIFTSQPNSRFHSLAFWQSHATGTVSSPVM